MAAFVALLGTAGGFFVVPVNALIQWRPGASEKVVPSLSLNMLFFIGVALPPLTQRAMLRFGYPDLAPVLLLSAAMTLLMAIVLLRKMPDLGRRALDWTRLLPRTNL